MKTQRRAIRAVAFAGLLLGLAPLAGAVKDELGFVRLKPDEVEWRESAGDNGLKFAVLAGDPSKPGLYVIRVKFPPGLMTRPHRHPEDRHAIVVSGTWYTGEGTTFDPERTVPLGPGSYMMHPANGYHFDGAKTEEVIVQIAGFGPSATTYYDPSAGTTGSSRSPH